MKAFIYNVIIKQFLSFIGVTPDGAWEKTIELVKKVAVEMATLTGADRRNAVVAELQSAYKELAPYLVNFLVEAAVSYLKALTII